MGVDDRKIVPVKNDDDKKKKKRVYQYARCPNCWERVVVSDADDPDRVVDRHARSTCWWVAKHGIYVSPELRATVVVPVEVSVDQ